VDQLKGERKGFDPSCSNLLIPYKMAGKIPWSKEGEIGAKGIAKHETEKSGPGKKWCQLRTDW